MNKSKENVKELLGICVQPSNDSDPEDASLQLHYAYSAIDFFRLGLEIGKTGEQVIFDEFEKVD